MTNKPALVAVLTLIAACGDAGQAARTVATKGTRVMDAATISACTASEATLYLAPEALMTRARLTAETLAERYPATIIRRGDPRLARLTEALRGLDVQPSSVPTIDPRLLVRVKCEDGRALEILGAATQPDGTTILSVDGGIVATKAPVRKSIEGLSDAR